MTLTRGGLQPAQLVMVDPAGDTVNFMFNPAKYTISKAVNYSEGTGSTGRETADKKFKQGQPRTLRGLELWFDTYTDGPNAQAVTTHSSAVWDLVKLGAPGADGRPQPPIVEFRWGNLRFRAVITSINEEFTLFKADGTPLRSKVAIDLQEKPDESATPDASNTTGSSANQHVVRTSSDAPLHTIAHSTTGDSNNYRQIAEDNNIENPRKIKNGISIKIDVNT